MAKASKKPVKPKKQDKEKDTPFRLDMDFNEAMKQAAKPPKKNKEKASK